MSDTAVDWTDLPPELLLAVATKLKTLADYIRFRAVCPNWCAAAPINPRYLPREFPWLMLPFIRTSNRCRLFNPLTNDLYRLTLPEASISRRIAGSSFGWLTLIDESPSIFIINPFTRDRIDLPPLTSFPNVTNFDFNRLGKEYTVRSTENDLHNYNLKSMRDNFIKRVILSHSPSTVSNFFAFAILNGYENVAYCKNGDGSWKFIDGERSYFEDVIYFNDSFYVVDKNGSIVICDLNDENPPTVRVINLSQEIDGATLPTLPTLNYLVNAMGDLLLVSRYLKFELGLYHCKTVKFFVYRFDWNARIWVSISSLVDKVLFLGANLSLAKLSSDYTGCGGNKIYFTDDYSGVTFEGLHGEQDVGVYNLADGTIESFPCDPCGSSHRPIWITPSIC